MRILHVTDVYLPRLGGIETLVSDLVAAQQARGVDAEVATITAASTPGAGAATADPAYVHRLEGGPLGALRGLRELIAVGRYDAVHVHISVWSPFSTLAARQVVYGGTPTLVTIHSMWSRLGPLPVLARELLRLRAWPMAWSAVSEAAAVPLREMLGPEIPVAVLGNAIDVAAWRPTGTVLPRPTEALRIIGVMRLTRVKRAVPLAEILHRVREQVPADRPLEAVVVGDGPRREAMRRVLARRGISSWVQLPGTLDRSAVRDLVGAADVFIAPAELESFGIAALEARAAGLPIVASSWGGVGDFVTPGLEGFLGRDDDEMVAALVRLLTDDDLRTSIARHNATVPPVHDWTLACSGASMLYERAIVAAGRPAVSWAAVPGGAPLP